MGSSSRSDVDAEDLDRISGMPDPVAVHILSFLPMEDAVRTGILSTRWGYLWTQVPVLDFESDECSKEGKQKFVNFVNYVLSLHEFPTLREFSLTFFTLGDSSPEKMNREDKQTADMFASQVHVWTRFMVKRKAEIICLNFSGEDERTYGILPTNRTLYKLPHHFFSNDSVKDLILDSCIIEPLKPIHWNSLKELKLVDCILNDEAIQNILSGTQLLNKLELIDCIGMKILNITSPKLEILDISLCSTSELTVTAPHVGEMNMYGGLAAYNFINLSSLQVAYITPRFEKIKDSHVEIMRRLVEALHCAQRLTLSTDSLQVLSMLEIQTQSFQSLGCTTLELFTNLTKWELQGIEQVLRTSLNLRNLIITPDEDSDSLQIKNKCVEKIEFSEENFWTSCLPLPCLSKTLMYVTVSDFTCRSSEIALVEFLLKNAKVLDVIRIHRKKTDDSSTDNWDTSIDLFNFKQKLLSIQKASAYASVTFH